MDGSSSINDCWTCPPGYFCPNDATLPTEKIQTCTEGYYCFEGVSAPTICPRGFYCPEGTNLPIPCPNGYYGATTGLISSSCSGPCTAGYYCSYTHNYSSWSYFAASLPFCMNGIGDLEHCATGSISATQTACPTGSYCLSGTVIPTPCPIGTYSSSNYNNELSDCVDCTGGEYCYSRGLSSPQSYCAAGYYCPEGSDESTAEECPAGYYCPFGSEAPTICPRGTYQANDVQTSCNDAESGWYCPDEGMSTQTVCPTGYYCANTATITPVACPEGTWSYIEGLKASSECMPCPYGKWCEWTSAGLPITSIADSQECVVLQYCYDVTSTGLTDTEMYLLDCVDGQICAANTIVPEYCAPGTYTNPAQVGPMSESNCLSCPAEKYCPDWGLTETDLEDCPAGYVCMGGAIHPSNLDDVTIKLCPTGSYCPGSSRLASEAVENVCPLSYYNPKLGQTVCLVCAAGFSCQETGLVWPVACPTGSYCPLYDPSSGVDNVVPCPAGTYSFDKYLYAESQCV